ncbi:MAG: MoaD/ThiS family protein [Candidatus Thorarchaeota archaeon]|nr:MAG: MoaD/ThiS family protein [Candidatus Thorarchaeota archaeon]
MELEVPDDSTVRLVIDRIIEIGGDEVKRLIMEGDRISGNLIVMLNKKDVATLNGEDTLVQENDEIAVLPHVQGG